MALIDAKALRIKFDKVYGFIWVYEETRFIILFGLEKYHVICDTVKYIIELKSGIT